MPGETTSGYPYPLDNDPVADYPATVQALAEQIDRNNQHGRVTVSLSNSHSGSQAVGFSALFAESPNVVLTPNNVNYVCSVSGLGTGGFTANVRHAELAAVTGSVVVYWHARGNAV